jgi:integrase
VLAEGNTVRGHIRSYQLKNGEKRWALVVYEGKHTGKDGQPKDFHRWTRGFQTKKKAQTELTRILRTMDEGSYTQPTKDTVGEFLDRWLITAKPNLAGKTYERYAQIVESDIKPKLGHIKLMKLQPPQIADFYTWALTSGRKRSGGGLSARTVLHIHRLLHRAFRQAVLWQLRATNPTDAVEAPRPVDKEMAALDEDRSAWLIQAAVGTPFYMPVVYGLCTALRRGEILAQRWRDIDLLAGQLTVAQSLEQTRAGGLKFKAPKGKKRRVVTMPSFLVEALNTHKSEQSKNRAMFGEDYRTDLDLVIALPDGSPWKPNSFSTGYAAFALKIGLTGVRFHDLRHSHASQLLRQRVPVKTVQERLGHANATITLNTYAHVLAGDDQLAVDNFERKLRSAIEKEKVRRAN